MPHTVKSRFPVCSAQLDADYLRQTFPWRIAEAAAPATQFPEQITAFDLGVGVHERVDRHLGAVRLELLAHAGVLDRFSEDCGLALWVNYEFPSAEGAINIHPSIHATLAMFRIELIIHLTPVS